MKKDNVFEETVKFDKKRFEEAIDKAFEKKKANIKLDGFRKGKVPKDVYYKKMGKESLYMDALDELLPEAYDEVMKNYKPIIDPKVDIKSIGEDGVEFIFTITTMPTVEISKYKGLNVKKEKVKVTAEEINHEMGHLLERFTELGIKEKGKVEAGNIAVIDFEGFKDGVAFEGGKGENYSLEIGSNTFIPGFEDQVIGMEKGEEKDIVVIFPENYHAEDLKGKEVTFKVKVHEIKEKQARELDEEFFEDLGLEGVNDEKTLKEEIKKNIEASKEREAEDKFVDEILTKIAENTKVDVPEELIEDEIHHMMHNFEDQIKMQGLSLEVFYEMTKSTEEDLKNQMKPEAEKHVLYRIILEKVKELEKIKVTDKAAEKEAEELAKKYSVEKEEFLNMYGGLEMLKYELEVKKVLELLMKENEKK
ncbi:MAG: trigger factor [Bacilli bacterium]|nr:trigger factor [Bacilli bacterium]